MILIARIIDRSLFPSATVRSGIKVAALLIIYCSIHFTLPYRAKWTGQPCSVPGCAEICMVSAPVFLYTPIREMSSFAYMY